MMQKRESKTGAWGLSGVGGSSVLYPTPGVVSRRGTDSSPKRWVDPLPRLFNIGGDVNLVRQFTDIDLKSILHIIEDLGIVFI